MSNPAKHGHQQHLWRQRLTPTVNAGNAHCWRCGRHIPPGTRWEAGHTTTDPNGPRAVECVRCNRADGGRRSPGQFKRRARAVVTSRRW